MALTQMYLVATKNLKQFLETIRSAKAPTKFTVRFLEDLGFKSTNDRLFIPMLKALRFLDDNGAPTKRYFEYLDDAASQRVLADGIRDAYEDLFRLNTRANTMTRADVTGKMKSLTEGKKSDAVLGNMVKTYLELVKYADFTQTPTVASDGTTDTNTDSSTSLETDSDEQPIIHAPKHKRVLDSVTYRIEIVLPAVRDHAVYDAIFKSLRAHLL